MKKLYAILVAVIITVSVLAQAPQQMSYQAVVRNSDSVLVRNVAVGMRVSILQNSSTGAVVYEETYSPNPQTNANGLVTLEIGGGISVNGTFSSINWSNGPYFIKIETDPTGGTNYSITGTSQLLSVPYALYSENSGGSPWTTSGNNIYNNNSGNVGIGAASPTTPLHVVSSTYGDIATFDGANQMFITLSELGTPKGYIGSYSGAVDDVDFGTYGSNGDGGINFTIQDQPQMTIAHAGNVGIGTTSPDGALTIVNNGAGLGATSIHTNNTNAAGIGLYCTTNSTDATAVFTNSTGSAGNAAIMAKFFDGGASDLVRIDNYGAGFHDGRITLFGDDNGGNGGYIYGFDNGVSIGDIVSGKYTDLVAAYNITPTTTAFGPSFDATTSCGSAYIRWNAVYAVNGNIQTSDERLKENVQPISYGLKELMSLNPVSYQWKNKQNRLGNGNNLGFLAQDLEKVLPDVVIHSQISEEELDNAKKVKGINITNTDTYGVKYSEMIPVLVKAIQEQQKEIEELKLQINSQQK